MAKAPWCGGYEAAQLLIERCFRRDGSLFLDDGDREIWTLANAEDLQARIDPPDTRPGSFIGKFTEQLAGASSDVLQLSAEMLYVEQLGEGDVGGKKKEENVTAILSLAEEPVPMPEDLREVLFVRGVATYGAGKNSRDAFMRLLVNLLVGLKSLDSSEAELLVDSPWDFLEFLKQFRTTTDGLQANSLLHLMYPEEFEYMISPGHRKELISAFEDLPGIDQQAEENRKVKVIRQAVDEALGREALLYDVPLERIWHGGTSSRWDETVFWSRKFFEWAKFDAEERDYKLAIAEKLANAREAHRTGSEDWLEQLKKAGRTSENNLTYHISMSKFLDWCEANPTDAKTLLGLLWDADDPREGLARFLAELPSEALSGTGTRLSVATFLAMATSATTIPFFKWTLYKETLGLLGEPPLSGAGVKAASGEADPADEMDLSWTDDTAEGAPEDKDSPGRVENETYDSWLRLLEELRVRMLAKGTPIRDLLDAQSLAYCLSLPQEDLPEHWSKQDKAAFGFFRNPEKAEKEDPEGPTAAPKEGGASVPSATAELSARTHLPQDWLQRDVLDLLEEKRQVILYGPPGTGKTFVAQKLGELFRAQGGETRLVQFHPSYTYEDFFEGYRPVGSEGSAIAFDLVSGPFREMAEHAEANPGEAHLLIIDEINRGNVAKIFGELYFLLEYRDKSIELQYSRERDFSMPKNLYVIGTMNTADRSIALVDSALRRRFYFVGFDPLVGPTKDVLPRWLERNELEPEPAEILSALNRAIDDQEFSIGPAYFMTPDGSEPNLDRIWKHAIKPLLEEHFYGVGRDIDAEFGLKHLRSQIAAEVEDEVQDEGDE